MGRWLLGWACIIALLCLAPAGLSADETIKSPRDLMIPILTYHRVLDKTESIYDFTPAQFEEHLIFLRKQGYHTISAPQFLEYMKKPAAAPEKPLMITFDDGHKSNYQKAFPLLRKYGFSGVFFVCTNLIAEKSEKQITWSELEEMLRAGMDIESHTITHPMLNKIRPKEETADYLKRLEIELRDSKRVLEQRLNRTIPCLAYPYGWFNKTVEEKAMEAGYQGIFTVNWGNNHPGQSLFRIKRRVMDHEVGFAELTGILTARPLDIEVIAPEDAVTIHQPPVIKFKLPRNVMKTVDIRVRGYKGNLTPDQNGVYTFNGVTALKPGYHMVVVHGVDPENREYVGTWGFELKEASPSALRDKPVGMNTGK